MTEKVQIKAPFRADLVGSLLRPERLKAAHQQLAIGEIKQDQELNIQHAAIERIVKRQVELGFKAVTDVSSPPLLASRLFMGLERF